MDIKEKLRLAAQQAENEEFKRLPPDSEIEWVPSEEFIAKIDEIAKSTPKRRLFTIRRFIIAAAVIALVSTAFIPVFMRNTDNPDSGKNHEGEVGNKPDEYYGYPTDKSDSATRLESDNWESISTSESIPPTSPSKFEFEPEYLPEGYILTDSNVSKQFSVLEYSNGSDVIRLYYYDGETDFSILEDKNDDFDDEAYYNNVPKTHYIEKDSLTDAIIEYIIFPDEVEWNYNNVAWNNSDMTFAVMGNENLSEDEIEKIAISVNIEPKE